MHKDSSARSHGKIGLAHIFTAKAHHAMAVNYWLSGLQRQRVHDARCSFTSPCGLHGYICFCPWAVYRLPELTHCPGARRQRQQMCKGRTSSSACPLHGIQHHPLGSDLLSHASVMWRILLACIAAERDSLRWCRGRGIRHWDAHPGAIMEEHPGALRETNMVHCT